MRVFRRPIRFEEVDAARIVFFARYLNFAHEAMEQFFDGLDGGYVRLVSEREVGLPAVDVRIRYSRPSRYGDVLLIETSTRRLGGRSAVLGYAMKLEASGELVCDVEHTVVVSDLTKMKSIEMPDDVRAAFAEHLDAAPATHRSGA